MSPKARARQALSRIPVYLWAGFLLAILLVLLATVTQGDAPQGAAQVTRADRVTFRNGVETVQPVALPQLWDDGTKTWGDEVHYRLRLPPTPPEATSGDAQLALLLPRIGVRFRVLFNGQEVESQAWRRGPGYFDAGTHAHLVPLPPSLRKQQWEDNRVEIQLQPLALHISGLAPVWIGPRDALQERHQRLIWWQVHLTWMVAASALIERLNAELAHKVSEREDELHAMFSRLRAAESQRVLETERRRLSRDMHDGLGSQLVQTLNLVHSSGERVESAAIAFMLSHALEELRMTLDSLEPMGGDLPTILGTLRQRIAPALKVAGIELDWQVQEVPVVPGLEARGVMHLFRCLQEVFANVVKHAHASRVTARTWQDGERICLSVTDNGVGLGEAPESGYREGGRGISNIRLRAAEIGAEVWFSGALPGTRVTFSFAHEGPVAGVLET